MYNPKDIVCGDFYWTGETENYTLFAAVDCTGHGVPGAFMSIIGYDLLQEAVSKRLHNPAEILNDINKGITLTLKQTYDDLSVKDGMDIALCVLEKKSKKLFFAGANNPLWILRDNQLLEWKGDKIPIGISYREVKLSFQTHEIQLNPGDIIYLFSDGFADQFGGKKGKKLMKKELRNMLLAIKNLHLKDQGIELQRRFEDWKGDLEQVDDVLVMGLNFF